MESRNKNTVFGKCRCCNKEGKHRDVMKEYQLNGAREVYYNMFMECFNLFLSTSQGITTLICWTCILRLRDALAFRTMVANVEQTLLGALADKETVFVNVPVEHSTEQETEVKPELSEGVKLELGESDNDYDKDELVEDDAMDYESDVGTQSNSENEPLKNLIRDASLVEGEAELVARFDSKQYKLPTRRTLYATNCASYVHHLDLLKDKIILPGMIARLLDGSTMDRSYSKKRIYITEKMAHIFNALTLLECSNLTPFKSKNRLGFPCYYCRNVFDNLEKLREHQAKLHRKGELKKILSGYGAECLVVYVDVTDLKCTVCGDSVPNLNELKSHLTKVHTKTFHTDFTDRVIPFKLAPSNIFECQVCGFSFETFGSIERHMNVHFRNYVCKECGSGFVTKYRLKVHTKSMHVDGNFPCEVCKKVFTTQQKQKNHVDTVHKMVKRFKCPKCQERFSEYFRRQKHLVDVHGVAPLQYKCNVCDKSFDRRYTLSRHMKRDHLEERDFQCQMCTYKCFTNNELRVHMIKHNGERVHECSVCKKSYARKKTLREHMRIHNDDRRFACAMCGQAFVQKCSLKGHIKTHHMEYSLQ